jgi:hypothetical protein
VGEAEQEAAEVVDGAGDAERARVRVAVLLRGAAEGGSPSSSARTAKRSAGPPSSPTHTGTWPSGTAPAFFPFLLLRCLCLLLGRAAGPPSSPATDTDTVRESRLRSRFMADDWRPMASSERTWRSRSSGERRMFLTAEAGSSGQHEVAFGW